MRDGLTLGSLFDGIAGFPLSASCYGIVTKWASEIEPFPIKVTQQHFPNMVHLGDVTKVNGAEVEPVGIISFGSPCQDMSVAGKRAGLEGERSGLFMEAVRIIKEMRSATNGLYPRFAIWENVPGAFSSNGGHDFRAVLEEVTEAEIPIPKSGRWAESGMVRGNGREVCWRVFDAQHWGVPQRRKRIFLVADFRGQCAGEILFERESLLGNSSESRKAREEVAAGVGDGLKAASRINCERGGISGTVSSKWAKGTGGPAGDEHYNLVIEQSSKVFYESGPGWIDECQKAGCLRAEGENRPSRPCHTIVESTRINCQPDGISGTISSKWAKGTGGPAGDEHYNLVCQEEITVNFEQTSDGITINPHTSVTLKASGGGGGAKTGLYLLPAYAFCPEQSAKTRGIGFQEEVSPTLRAEGVTPAIAFTANQRDEVRDLGDKSGALQAEPGMKQQTFIAELIAFNGRQDPVSGDIAGTLDTCHPQAQCVAIQHSIIGRKDEAGAQGPGFRDDGKMFTLDSRGSAYAVAYPDPANTLLAKGNLSYRGDVDTVVAVDVRNLNETEELNGTLQAKNGGGYSLNYINPIRIPIRGEENGNAAEGNAREILFKLWQEIGAEAFAKWGSRILNSLQQETILRQEVYEGSVSEEAQGRDNELEDQSQEVSGFDSSRDLSRVREETGEGCSPQGQRLPEQRSSELNSIMQRLSQLETQESEILCNLWRTNEGIRVLRETLHQIQEIWQSDGDKNSKEKRLHDMWKTSQCEGSVRKTLYAGNESRKVAYRVRRLTPTETLRLQGMPDWWLDIEGASDSAKYKAVGNSVAIPCAEFIFDQIVKVLGKEQAPCET
jgi:site-specific DNA-cytosine methylase